MRDVSPHNDWSQVIVWNAISRDFGTQIYPTYGFIYAHGGHQPRPAPYVAQLPDDVALILASAPTAETQDDAVPGFELAVAKEIAHSTRYR